MPAQLVQLCHLCHLTCNVWDAYMGSTIPVTTMAVPLITIGFGAHICIPDIT